MRIGPVPDAMKPDFQGVLTPSNQGFIAFSADPEITVTEAIASPDQF
jgi:hypothetical protein